MINVEVVDVPLEYNILLGHNWIYNMKMVVSFLFQVVCFPFEGRIVTIAQKYFDNSGTKASLGATIPVIDNSQLENVNVGVGMYLSLMGTFNIFTPILTIHYIIGSESSSSISIPFCVFQLEDPWTFPSLSTSDEDPRPTKMDMSLSTVAISYKPNRGLVVDPSPSSSSMEEEGPYARSSWVVASSHSHDFFDETFSSNESILKAMNGLDGP